MRAFEGLDRSALDQVMLKHDVATLRVFGSAISDRFDPATSDIDFLVEFTPQAERTFHALLSLKENLEGILGYPVDLVEPASIRNPYFARTVFAEAQEFYAA